MTYKSEKIDRPENIKAFIYSQTCSTKGWMKEFLDLAHKRINDPHKQERIKQLNCVYCYYSGKWGGSRMTNVSCHICNDELMFGSTCVDRLCSACAFTYFLCKHCGADLELKNRRG
jgi:hypothetical protein